MTISIRYDSLSPALRAEILDRAGIPRPKARPRSKPLPASSGIVVCACGTAIWRPDGQYPEECDGCGNARKC